MQKHSSNWAVKVYLTYFTVNWKNTNAILQLLMAARKNFLRNKKCQQHNLYYCSYTCLFVCMCIYIYIYIYIYKYRYNLKDDLGTQTLLSVLFIHCRFSWNSNIYELLYYTYCMFYTHWDRRWCNPVVVSCLSFHVNAKYSIQHPHGGQVNEPPVLNNTHGI